MRKLTERKNNIAKYYMRKLEKMDKETKELEKDPLYIINSILLEQLDDLKNLDMKDDDKFKKIISKSNAITSTSKTLLQSIVIQQSMGKLAKNSEPLKLR